MKKKIGLAGKSGSGKNVIADMICSKYGYRQLAVADGIREEASTFLERILYLNEPASSLGFDLVIAAFKEAIWAKPTPSEIRVLLQWWGTEYRRTQDKDYWINLLTNRLKNDDLIVVSDVRLPDEMKVVRENGGEVWLVERNGIENVGIKGHATEHGLQDVVFDRVIINDDTLEELENTIDSLFVPEP